LKNPIIKSASKLVSYLAVSTIVFGILFEEFFGELVGKKVFGMLYIAELLEKVFGKYPLLHRQEEGDIIAFLILAISIGACHVLLGLILGIVEAIKQRHKKEVFEKISIILSLFGLFFLVATMSNLFPKGFFVPSVALLVVSLPVLIVVKGFIGPLEAISTVANILSYARLMAVGTASVMMAYVANEFGGRIGNIILGIIVASLIHILNIALAAFSPTIQSVRLHYVEFFGKFYEQGGKKYIPFKKEGHV
jgi:V/A-type H+-transporting ATPase subunit I